MTSATVRRSFAFGVVTATSGRVPAFIHLPWCHFGADARSGSGRERFLRTGEERKRRGEELVRAFGHEQMSASLDEPHLRVREDLTHRRRVTHRKNTVFPAPEHQHGTRV